jgi:hypothetical protein
MWLNDKKVKETEFATPCYGCVFNRNVLYHQFKTTCLLRIFNLRNDDDWCIKGYVYENMA